MCRCPTLAVWPDFAAPAVYGAVVLDIRRLSEDVASWLAAWTPPAYDSVVVERAEAVVMHDGGPGVMVLWAQTTHYQGLRRFGLLMSAAALVQESDNDADPTESITARLALAIIEPHGTDADPATRTWFTHIP